MVSVSPNLYMGFSILCFQFVRARMSKLQQVSSTKYFGGLQKVFSHESNETKCKMTFGVYLPASAVDATAKSLPVLYWLSGLTCTERNFIDKSAFQKYAAEHEIIVVNPDTSPRGLNIDGEEDSWDFGSGAGFYVDATQPKWANNYRMYSYVTKELPALISSEFSFANGKRGIFGHSMGGHGALICGLNNSEIYSSISAIEPISNPINCPWGIKAFSGYLGDDKSSWVTYDSCDLVSKYSGPQRKILVDQGTEDGFLKDGQLLPENLVKAAKDNEKVEVEFRSHEGYDHSFAFIATVIGDHFKHHATILKQ